MAAGNGTEAKSGNGTAATAKFEQLSVILPLAVDGLMLGWSLWLVASILVYGVRTNRFRRRSSHDFNGGVVYTFAFLSALLLAVRLTMTILMVVVPPYYPNSGSHCAIIYDITIVSYTVALVPVYLLLWLRQRVLYSHPSMAGLHNKGMIFLSWGSLVFLVGAAIALTTVFIYRDNFSNGYYGCIETDTSTTNLPNVLMVVVLVIGQVMLLGLFVIPLRGQSLAVRRATTVHKRRLSTRILYSVRRATTRREDGKTTAVCHTRAASTSQVPSNAQLVEAQTSSTGGGGKTESAPHSGGASMRASRRKKRSVDRIRRILLRSVFFGVVCAVSDLATMILTTFAITRTEPRNVPFMLYDISLLVNVMSVVFSFDNYKTMILAPCYDDTKVKSTVTELSSRQHSAGSEN